MIKQISITAASVTLLTACSGFQAAEPELYTIGDETTISSHSSAYPMAEGSESSYPLATSDSYSNNRDLSVKGVNVMNDMSYVTFSFDSASLSSEARSQLSSIADKIRESGAKKVVVEGHCDERGTREYNLALGDRRAVAVKKYLVGLGVSSSSLTTISYGKERPKNPAHNEAAWAENRRGVVNFK